MNASEDGSKLQVTCEVVAWGYSKPGRFHLDKLGQNPATTGRIAAAVRLFMSGESIRRLDDNKK
jgi:hypothetical protein